MSMKYKIIMKRKDILIDEYEILIYRNTTYQVTM